MTTGLDTSVVLRLLTGTPPAQYEAARKCVEQCATPVMISDLVVAESYFALLHHYKVPHVDAIRSLLALVSDSRVSASGVAARVLRDMEKRPSAKNAVGLVDRLIHADYARDDTTLVTFDRDLARMEGVQLLT